MTPDNGNKAHRTAANVFYLPGINKPDTSEAVQPESIDSVESCRRALIESQRNVALKVLCLDPKKLIVDQEKAEVRILISPGKEVPVLQFYLDIQKKKPDLKPV